MPAPGVPLPEEVYNPYTLQTAFTQGLARGMDDYTKQQQELRKMELEKEFLKEHIKILSNQQLAQDVMQHKTEVWEVNPARPISMPSERNLGMPTLGSVTRPNIQGEETAIPMPPEQILPETEKRVPLSMGLPGEIISGNVPSNYQFRPAPIQEGRGLFFDTKSKKYIDSATGKQVSNVNKKLDTIKVLPTRNVPLLYGGKTANELNQLINNYEDELKRIAPNYPYYTPDENAEKYYTLQSEKDELMELLKQKGGVKLQAKGMIKYKIGDDIYEIPTTESASFLKENPKAIKVK